MKGEKRIMSIVPSHEIIFMSGKMAVSLERLWVGSRVSATSVGCSSRCHGDVAIRVCAPGVAAGRALQYDNMSHVIGQEKDGKSHSAYLNRG